MTVGQLLDDIRNRYLTQFRQTISEVEQAGMEAMTDAAHRDEDGALARQGNLNQALRLDIVGLANDEARDRISVHSKKMLSFEPIDFEWTGGVPIRLAPFHWDACAIRVFGIPRTTEWSRLRDWFDRWFDVEDANQPDEHGFYGVIHFLSDPQFDGSATTFQVDFGSAPEEAFETLLDALRDCGAAKIEVGHNQEG